MIAAAPAFLCGFGLHFLLSNYAELESDVGVEVILLHLDDGDPAEVAKVTL